ncbi:hypothetical protein C8R43DRAFT_917891 [Mycena crocata]|nr:hypothetical protein C8R43DRAFT_917891 [Mycena crocata]
MATNLPDEIIHEILSPALRVSDETFSTTSVSPFAKTTESSSAFLLVSKAWLRVATPLLYGVVILRSKAQAQALAVALRSNPNLGRFIRKLRVEGGFAISMHKILQASTNITDILLYVEIVPSDNVCGLCRGLPLIDPVRVILCHAHDYSTRTATKLEDVLHECILKRWKKLAVVDIPYDLYPDFSETLSSAPRLNTLIIADADDDLFEEWQENSSISIVAANPSLQHIRLRPPPPPKIAERYRESVKSDLRLQALLELPKVATPFFYPSQLATDKILEDTIWDRVLHFSMHSGPLPGDYSNSYDRYLADDSDSDVSDFYTSATSLSPLLVSKTFARLGIPHLYSDPVLVTPRAMQIFRRRLTEDPSLGLHVRNLSIGGNCHDVSDFALIIARVPALKTLDGNGFPLSWKVFNEFSNAAGPNLHRFGGMIVDKAAGHGSPTVFSLFPRMQSFAWSSKTVFKTGASLIPTGTFDLLVELTIQIFDASFMTVLSQMELPSLRNATFGVKAIGGNVFFQKHGAKLRKLRVSVAQINSDLDIFRLCPRLTLFGITYDGKRVPRQDAFDPSCTHKCLERIVFKCADPFTWETAPQHKWDSLFKGLKTVSFPSLQEIEHDQCDWPRKEQGISQSQWVWTRRSEYLLEQNIHLVDSKGVRWRPRLKFVTKEKKGKKSASVPDRT